MSKRSHTTITVGIVAGGVAKVMSADAAGPTDQLLAFIDDVRLSLQAATSCAAEGHRHNSKRWRRRESARRVEKAKQEAMVQPTGELVASGMRMFEIGPDGIREITPTPEDDDPLVSIGSMPRSIH